MSKDWLTAEAKRHQLQLMREANPISLVIEVVGKKDGKTIKRVSTELVKNEEIIIAI